MQRILARELPNASDKQVLIRGWLNNIRAFGKLTFLDPPRPNRLCPNRHRKQRRTRKKLAALQPGSILTITAHASHRSEANLQVEIIRSSDHSGKPDPRSPSDRILQTRNPQRPRIYPRPPPHRAPQPADRRPSSESRPRSPTPTASTCTIKSRPSNISLPISSAPPLKGEPNFSTSIISATQPHSPKAASSINRSWSASMSGSLPSCPFSAPNLPIPPAIFPKENNSNSRWDFSTTGTKSSISRKGASNSSSQYLQKHMQSGNRSAWQDTIIKAPDRRPLPSPHICRSPGTLF